MNRFPHLPALVLLASAGLAPSPAEGVTLDGRVRDIGILDTEKPGIAGVRVEVRDAPDSVRDAKLTDGDGNYRFDNLPAGLTVTVVHDKLGYEQRRTARSVTLVEEIQPIEVFLIKTIGLDDAYLQDIGRALFLRDRNESPGHQHDPVLLESLEPALHERVRASIAAAARDFDAGEDSVNRFQQREMTLRVDASSGPAEDILIPAEAPEPEPAAAEEASEQAPPPHTP